MTSLPRPRPVAERSGVDAASFADEVRAGGQPVVMRGLAAAWPAVQAAMQCDEAFVDYLKAFVTPQPVIAIVGQPEIKGRFFYNEDATQLNFGRGTSPLAPFLDRLLRDREHAAPIAMAVQSEPVANLLPRFEADNRIDLLSASVQPRAWLGNRIRVAPHYDLMENIGIVVAGRRRFTLFPPDQIGNLYPGPLELTPAGTPVSMVELAAPDLDRYPRFVEAARHAQVAELEPGDAIYIPYHWWHGVDSLAPVNLFVNYWWNDAAQTPASPYDALMHAMLALRALPPDQREVWRMTFDHYVFERNGDPGAHLPPAAKGTLGPLDAQQQARIKATLREAVSR